MISLLLPSWPKTLAICLAFFFCLVAKPARAAEPPGVAIGSKSFTESVILGEILSQLARQTGAVVSHRAELGGTRILWEALKKGDIDAYVDYTGTIRDELLAGELPASSPVANNKSNDFPQLRAGLQKHQIHLSMPLGFNNTYALGMRETLAAKLSIKTISDLQKQSGLALGLSDEFVERKDQHGFDGV
jgi:osmoprotectant transport system permease protein